MIKDLVKFIAPMLLFFFFLGVAQCHAATQGPPGPYDASPD